uniref:Uncharacterized protein n=1 Tax=Anopheles maculatus TaxID=74869 RepID=A0A182SQ59_9DIPT
MNSTSASATAAMTAAAATATTAATSTTMPPSSIGNGELYFRPLPYLSFKWIKADVGRALRNADDLANLWNHLIQDEEVITERVQTAVNGMGEVVYLRPDGRYYCGNAAISCDCCKGVCSAVSKCICLICEELGVQEGGDSSSGPGATGSNGSNGMGRKSQNHSQSPSEQPSTGDNSASSVLLDSWLWSPIPGECSSLLCNGVEK